MSKEKQKEIGDEDLPKQGFLFYSRPNDSGRKKKGESALKRKLQVANGYLLEFDNISRVLSASYENRSLNRVSRSILIEATGFPDRQVGSLMSMASAMGLILPRVQTPTAFGSLAATHDIFFERPGTLEWCHYQGAGSVRNLVWFDVFNRLLVQEDPMAHPEWNAWFRKELAGQYSERTMRKVVQEEVHFVIDAYMEKKLKALGILGLGDDDEIVLQRHRQIDHLVFAAMLYDFVESHGGRTFEISELTRQPGSPSVVFGLDADSVRTLVEALHTEGLLRYETTHNLDQIRLIPGYEPEEFLTAYYESRRPQRNDGEGDRRG